MNEPVYLVRQSWDADLKAAFLRRRRARNYVLLGALGGLCLLIYVITLVKLHEFGPLW